MFFTSFVMVYDGEGLTPALSPMHLVSSSLSPLSTSIACTIAFAATAVIWTIVSFLYSGLIAIFFIFYMSYCLLLSLYVFGFKSAFYETALY